MTTHNSTIKNYKVWWNKQMSRLPKLEEALVITLEESWSIVDNIFTLQIPNKPQGYSDAVLGLSLEKVHGDQPQQVLDGQPHQRRWILKSGGKYVIKAILKSKTHPSFDAQVEIYVRL
jgi:hypothetical protein